MFPGAGASIHYNEAGEPVSWDYPSCDEPPNPDDFDRYEDDFDGDEEPLRCEADVRRDTGTDVCGRPLNTNDGYCDRASDHLN